MKPFSHKQIHFSVSYYKIQSNHFLLSCSEFIRFKKFLFNVLLLIKCTAQCYCNNSVCSSGCGASGKCWSTSGATCSLDSDVSFRLVYKIH